MCFGKILKPFASRMLLTSVQEVMRITLQFLYTAEDSLSSREHKEAEDPPNQNPNPGSRGSSVNVVLKVWRWISVSEETL